MAPPAPQPPPVSSAFLLNEVEVAGGPAPETPPSQQVTRAGAGAAGRCVRVPRGLLGLSPRDQRVPQPACTRWSLL